MIRYGEGSLGTITIGVYKGLPLLDPRYVKGNVKPETFTGKENYGVFLVGPDGMEYACLKESNGISDNRIVVKITDGLPSGDFGLKGFYYKAGEATPYEFYLDKVFTIAKNVGPAKDLNLYYDVTVYNVGVDGLSAYQAYITKLKPKTYASEKVWLNALLNVFNVPDVYKKIDDLQKAVNSKIENNLLVLLETNIEGISDEEPTTPAEGETTSVNKLHIVDNTINNELKFYKNTSELFTIEKADLNDTYKVLTEKALLNNLTDSINTLVLEKLDLSLEAINQDIETLKNSNKAFKDGGNIEGGTPNHWEKLETLLDTMRDSLKEGNPEYIGNYHYMINNIGNINISNYAYLNTKDPNINTTLFVVLLVQGNIRRTQSGYFALVFDDERGFHTYIRITTSRGSTDWSLYGGSDSSSKNKKALEGKKIGILGGSQITHAFDNGSLAEELRFNSFPIKEALLKEGVKEIELKAHEGAGMCIPEYRPSLTSGLINVCQLAETIGVCDIYVILLLTNDYTGNSNIGPTKIGDLTDISIIDAILDNTATFYGALAYTVNTLLNKNSKARILFITPTKCVIGNGGYKATNAGFSKNLEHGYTIKEEGKEDKPIGILYSFVEALQKFCDYYSYPCLDIFNSGIGAFTSNPITNEVQWKVTHLDSTHLNEEGYRQLSHKIVNFIIENL